MATPEEIAAAEAAAKAEAEKTAAAVKAQADKDAAEAKAKENDPAFLKAELEKERKAKDDFKNDMLKYKKVIQDQEEAKAKATAEALEKEKAAMAGKGEFEALYRKSEERAAELQRKLEGQAKNFIADKKLTVVQAKAIELGLLPAAVPDLQVVELAGIETIQGDQGTIQFNGIEAFVAKLKAERPHWFGAKVAPKVNFGGGSGNSAASVPDGELTPAQIVELEAKDKEAYQAYMNRHFIKKAGA